MSVLFSVKVASCKECPHVTSRYFNTGDSFDNEHDYYCKAMKPVSVNEQYRGMADHATSEDPGRKIGQVGTWDKFPEIPEWCPLPKSN